MFPYHRPPRRPPFHPPFGMYQSQQPSPLQYFKTKDGKWDFDKISNSINQANKLVGQVNPLIQQFKSFMKK